MFVCNLKVLTKDTKIYLVKSGMVARESLLKHTNSFFSETTANTNSGEYPSAAGSAVIAVSVTVTFIILLLAAAAAVIFIARLLMIYILMIHIYESFHCRDDT